LQRECRKLKNKIGGPFKNSGVGYAYNKDFTIITIHLNFKRRIK